MSARDARRLFFTNDSLFSNSRKASLSLSLVPEALRCSLGHMTMCGALETQPLRGRQVWNLDPSHFLRDTLSGGARGADVRRGIEPVRRRRRGLLRALAAPLEIQRRVAFGNVWTGFVSPRDERVSLSLSLSCRTETETMRSPKGARHLCAELETSLDGNAPRAKRRRVSRQKETSARALGNSQGRF